MKIVLDNCVDIHAKVLFTPHEVLHVLDLGWDSLSNGKLIAAAAAAGFEILLTVDKNIRHHQNLNALPVAVIELDVVKNRLEEISKLAVFVPRAIELTGKFRFVSVKADGKMECLGERGGDR